LNSVAVVTGTTHGIGRVTARELAKAGYTVVMLCRNLETAAALRSEIVAQLPRASVHAIQCDLASLSSVRACAEAIRGEFERIALLINNAGIVSTRHRMSADGFELTFATNHLGPFLLTSLLLDRVSEHGRIINVASRVHYRGRLDLAPLTDARAGYSSMAAYAQSKLVNVLFTFALARRLSRTGITANCLHPGVVATNLLPRWLRIVKPLISQVIFDAERGARTTLHLALSDQLAAISGRYFDEHQSVQVAAPLANEVGLQESLWEASERWTSLRAARSTGASLAPVEDRGTVRSETGHPTPGS
jgi:NAD(P)-dependent dehydrogenase (short-subunit alcohol dehydrogenase family)